MRDHEDRLPAAVHLAEETEQLVRGFAVERAGRLVGEQDARLCDERAGNGGALLLAAGDLVGVLFQKLADAERFRNIDEAGAHLIVALAREDEREIDVILKRERVEQVELLKHEPEMVAAERGGLAFADLGKVPPVEQHRAGGGLVKRGENVQKRRFAAAALAHDGDILALVHGEIDVAERLDRIAAEAGLIYFFQPGNIQ